MKAAEIIDLLRLKLGVRSDLALAKRLDIPQGTVAKWRKSGSISAGAAARIAVALGQTLEEIVKQERARGAVTQAVQDLEAVYRAGQVGAQLVASHDRLDALVKTMPFNLIEPTEQLLAYMRSARVEDVQTITRLLAGLQAGADVRNHLIGQLKLIEELVQAKKGVPPGETEDAPPRAKAG
jgi:transcriptional regulator with XRE-family HTH domain